MGRDATAVAAQRSLCSAAKPWSGHRVDLHLTELQRSARSRAPLRLAIAGKIAAPMVCGLRALVLPLQQQGEIRQCIYVRPTARCGSTRWRLRAAPARPACSRPFFMRHFMFRCPRIRHIVRGKADEPNRRTTIIRCSAPPAKEDVVAAFGDNNRRNPLAGSGAY
jgi:hypothetical protein